MKKTHLEISADNKAVRSQFVRLLPSILIVFVCALSIPLANNLYVRITCASLCVLYLVITANHKIATMLLLLLLFGVFGFNMGLMTSSFILAMIVGTGVLAWLISYTKSPYLAIIVVLAHSISTFVTKNWFASLLSFAFVIPAVIAAISIEKKSSRIGSICRISASIVAIAMGAVIITSFYFLNGFRISMVRDFVRDFTYSLAKAFSSLEVSLINGVKEKMFTETDSYNLAVDIIALLPAMLIVSANLIAYFAQRIQFNLMSKTGKDYLLTEDTMVFTMSPTAGILYGLTFMVLTLCDTSPTGYVVSNICKNMFAIFIPGLSVAGILWYMSYSERKRSPFRIWILVLFFALLLFNFQAAVLLMASVGAFVSVSGPLKDFINSKMGDA